MTIKKIVFALLFLNLVLINPSYSQNYNAIDSIVLKYPNFGSTEKLTERIQKDFTSEHDKARAIYSWIALNINYDVEKFLNPPASKVFSPKKGYEIDKQIEDYHNSEIKKTFRTKKGVCEDFSRLYERIGTLCGLKVKIIKGDAKIHLNDIGRKRLYTSHAWNEVEVDGKWISVDATWGGGYLNYKTKTVVKEFTPIYFNMDPKYFYAKHFPESEIKNLNLDKEVYLDGPLIYDIIIEKKCEILFPKSGTINVNNGDKIFFKIKNLSEFDDLYCYDDNSESLEIINLKEENNILEFEVLPKKKIAKSITLYIHENPLVAFKIITK